MNWLPVLLDIVTVIAVVWVVGFIVFHATDIVKLVTRWVAMIPALNWVAIKGYGSYLTALILAAVTVFWPGSGMLTPLTNVFAALNIPVNATFLGVLVTFLTAITASSMHNSGKMPTPLASSKVPKG